MNIYSDTDKDQMMEYYKNTTGVFGEATMDRMLTSSNDLYRSVKGRNWKQTHSHNSNMKYHIGCNDGKRFVAYEQANVQYLKDEAKHMRDMYREYPDCFKTIHPGANYPAMHLPKAIAHEISNKYFSGVEWDGLKHDVFLKNQFYRVVNSEYSDFVIHPSGKIPLSMDVPYPSTKGI